METLLSLTNAAACGLISLTLIGIIISPRIHEGAVIKAGLISMALGFGAIALRLVDGYQPQEIVGIERALLLINAGIAVVMVGYLCRRVRAHHPVRRSTDWGSLDVRPLRGGHS